MPARVLLLGMIGIGSGLYALIGGILHVGIFGGVSILGALLIIGTVAAWINFLFLSYVSWHADALRQVGVFGFRIVSIPKAEILRVSLADVTRAVPFTAGRVTIQGTRDRVTLDGDRYAAKDLKTLVFALKDAGVQIDADLIEVIEH